MNGSIDSQTSQIEIRVDLVIFCLKENRLKVLLSAQTDPQVGGEWKLPGSQVLSNEALGDTAQRVLETACGTTSAYLEQLYTYGDPARDPRYRSVSCAYLGLLRPHVAPPHPKADAKYVWFAVDATPILTLDHNEILSYALERLRYKLEYTALGFQLLPEDFTLSELQIAYETILGEELDKRNFRRRILAADIIEPISSFRTGEGRPARLYQYRQDAVAEVKARRLFP